MAENDDSITFPFYLNCQQWRPPYHYEYELVLSYHVDLVNNWQQIVRDQLNTLEKCGLGSAASSRFIVTYSHGEESELKNVLKEFSFSSRAIYYSAKSHSEQGFTTSWKMDMCRDISEKQKKGIIFHFYAMGSHEYHWDWWRHRSQHDEGPYSRALYWRKYHEYFGIENPERCIDAIMNGALTCGINLQAANGHWRYTDDFLVSSCDYEQSLEIAADNGVSSTSTGVCEAKSIGNHLQSYILPNKAAHAELHKTKKDRNSQLPYPEEYDDTAWRFRLKCPQDDLPKGDYRLVLTYHVGMIGNWRDIVMDQLNTISKCGLGRNLDEFVLSYANGKPDELLEIIKSYDIAVEPQLVPVQAKPWECPANNATLALCNARPSDDDRKTVVFYLHNKGSSRYEDNWRQKMDRDKQYGKTGVYWRKFLEYFHIERPSLCIEKILNGGMTCASAIRGRHYSGNFWVASCDYISQLEPCGAKSTNYIESEHWLGRAMGGGTLDPDKYVELYRAPRVDGGSNAQLMYLYRHLILPEEYADATYGVWVKNGSPPSDWEESVVEKKEVVTGKLSAGNLKAGRINRIILDQQEGDEVKLDDGGTKEDGGVKNYFGKMKLEDLKRLANSNMKTPDGRPVRIEVSVGK
eukprot:CAMPEP_0197725450 /NCGR_PEP_ID=MMETSP1434-20131217/6983_1 /TAXON_ID=265543 /ORGANISM="Minutocellus polymorphus, Strain CCMP3303" /LENGTH=633 /DNA_ID=CAMNT_0043310925 /DNA_START=214 /DNA_END=2115 /DNA_ORIENTATION=-